MQRASFEAKTVNHALILITILSALAPASAAVPLQSDRAVIAAHRTSNPAPIADGPDLKQSIPALEAAIPRLMAEGAVPGLTIALIQHNQPVWIHAFGVRNAKTGARAEAGTLFQAASMSKPLFALGVLKLVDEGKLDLDAPLSKYLPGPYIEGDDRINLISARIVLTHSTGFPNWRPNGGPLKINFQPGLHFSYSGEGFVYLQRVVEHITGEGLDEYMKKSVMEPLGMTSSSYVWEDRYSNYEPGFATGHNSVGMADPENH